MAAAAAAKWALEQRVALESRKIGLHTNEWTPARCADAE
eukprot:CAMPEP_0115868476 /NCGR_PEP_ID=MMETSP0287-20121206/21315_1 /TAXON_ID=412157 /ORGANISM="Chrysochromulina rotalis, Strain UIO044" /LENGTH=38 /DNA_ID= /DNA_START= /DNA_END= /DNA_ORIENTATION=